MQASNKPLPPPYEPKPYEKMNTSLWAFWIAIIASFFGVIAFAAYFARLRVDELIDAHARRRQANKRNAPKLPIHVCMPHDFEVFAGEEQAQKSQILRAARARGAIISELRDDDITHLYSLPELRKLFENN